MSSLDVRPDSRYLDWIKLEFRIREALPGVSFLWEEEGGRFEPLHKELAYLPSSWFPDCCLEEI